VSREWVNAPIYLTINIYQQSSHSQIRPAQKIPALTPVSQWQENNDNQLNLGKL